MRIGLTGTPGVGKSTLARLLADAGRIVIDLNEWAKLHGAIAGEDDDGTVVIDTERINLDDMPSDCIIDSHMSHNLAVDVVWLIRLDPRPLRQRLAARGYTISKVMENVEAEAMDLILQEAMAEGRMVIQRDGTHRSPEELLTSFMQATTEGIKSSDLEDVDWSDALLEGI